MMYRTPPAYYHLVEAYIFDSLQQILRILIICQCRVCQKKLLYKQHRLRYDAMLTF